MRPLGHKQKGMIRSLLEHGSWRDSDREWWYWDTRSGTRKILDSLVARGVVQMIPKSLYGPAMYTLTDPDKAKEMIS